MSTSPASRASRSAQTKTPVPPIGASGAREVSPAVAISTSSTGRAPSRAASSRRSATRLGLGGGERAAAGAEPRVGTRSCRTPARGRLGRGRGRPPGRRGTATASAVEVEQLAQRVGVGRPPGSSASSFTRTVGVCSSFSTTRWTVRSISVRTRASRSGSRPSSRASSASTTSAASARSATTVGATRRGPLPPRKPATSSATIARTAVDVARPPVAGAGPAERLEVDHGDAGQRARPRGRRRAAAPGRVRPGAARPARRGRGGELGSHDVADRAGAGDDEVGLGQRRGQPGERRRRGRRPGPRVARRAPVCGWR